MSKKIIVHKGKYSNYFDVMIPMRVFTDNIPEGEVDQEIALKEVKDQLDEYAGSNTGSEYLMNIIDEGIIFVDAKEV